MLCFDRAERGLDQAGMDVTRSFEDVLADDPAPACERRLTGLRDDILGAMERRFDTHLALATVTGPEEEAEVRRMIDAAFDPIDEAYSSARAACGG